MEPDRDPESSRQEARSPSRSAAWLRRAGFAGFLFFFFKGLLWLLVPALLAGRRWFGD